jgi:hypothetical protein
MLKLGILSGKNQKFKKNFVVDSKLQKFIVII